MYVCVWVFMLSHMRQLPICYSVSSFCLLCTYNYLCAYRGVCWVGKQYEHVCVSVSMEWGRTGYICVLMLSPPPHLNFFSYFLCN